ncbi:MAG: tetratricopeptide repeat protein [Deltaproteobacteria bacterium]|nr:tetratricopeptide repeat protein [Candidatus Tharpella sp.]
MGKTIIMWPKFCFILLMPGKGELPESEASIFVSLQQEKKWAEAVKLYESILSRRHNYLPALNALAKVAYENKDYEASLQLLARIMKKHRPHPLWLNNLAVVMAARNDISKAEIIFRKALTYESSTVEILYNWGCLLVCQGRSEMALEVWRQGLDRQSSHRSTLFALSRLCKELGLVAEATRYCRQLVAMVPGEAEYRQNLGLMLLKQGELLEGFKLYEARWQANRLFTLPAEHLWDGNISQLKDKTILLWAEQGFGDTLQFARYLSQLRTIAKHVITAVPDLLVGLMRSSFPLLEVVSIEKLKKINYQLQAPLLSLPYLFGSSLDNLPDQVPYLQIEEDFLERWREVLGGGGKLCVGLVWGGNPAHRNDVRRSMPISLFAALFRLDGVMWYSLQKGEQEKELEDFLAVSGSSDCLANLAPKLDSFEDTAAAIDLLDLVISVDTSVAHLAGALARPTWVLLPFDADWRWMLERHDSPWYPTMRLFRQPEPGNWESVIVAVQNSLEDFVRGRQHYCFPTGVTSE